VNAPRLRIEPLGVPRREGDGWRTTWRITSVDRDAVRVIAAIAPHSKFRGETALDLEVRAKRSKTFALVVRVDGVAGSEIENAFVIAVIQRGGEQWRLLARLRVSLDNIARPRPSVEAVTVQRVGFSGEL
jgi:acetyl-CoA acetyltransferase